MPDTKQLLERTARRAPSPGYHPETIRDRAAGRRRSERRRASVLALALTVLAGVAAFTLVRSPAGSDAATGVTGDGESLPPATAEPVVAGDGEYYYRSVLLVSPCGPCNVNDVALDATMWWSPNDDSGRIVVDASDAYGIDAGRFGPGAFPNWNGIDVSDFPSDPHELLGFLLDRSKPNGGSPAPLVTPPPGGAPFDGQLWRAITDLLEDPHTTPAVRASLLEAAALLDGSTVALDGEDPFGRSAHVIEFAADGGTIIDRLYVDPASHDLLTWTGTTAGNDTPGRYYVVQDAGVTSSTETAIEPGAGSVPSTMLSVEDLRSIDGASGDPTTDVVERCSQGGPDLALTRSTAGYDRDCFVIEAGAPFSLTFRIEDDGDGAISIRDEGGDPVYAGDPLTGPGEVRYEIPAIEWVDDGPNRYEVRDGETFVGTLYVR